MRVRRKGEQACPPVVADAVPCVSKEDVLQGLLREARGEPHDTSSASRVTAWRLLGDHLGMWEQKRDQRPMSGLERLVEHMAARREERDRERGQG